MKIVFLKHLHNNCLELCQAKKAGKRSFQLWLAFATWWIQNIKYHHKLFFCLRDIIIPHKLSLWANTTISFSTTYYGMTYIQHHGKWTEEKKKPGLRVWYLHTWEIITKINNGDNTSLLHSSTTKRTLETVMSLYTREISQQKRQDSVSLTLTSLARYSLYSQVFGISSVERDKMRESISLEI